MYTGYIYKVTNNINGKSYIGKTVDLERRWNQHKSGNGNTSILDKALRKYGVDNFVFTEIDRVHSYDKKELDTLLSKLEIYYIGIYNTYKYGYNATIGGEGSSGFSPSQETRLKMSLAKKGKPVSKKRREAYNSSAKRRRGIPRDKEIIAKGALKRRKPILQYSLNGMFIQEYLGATLVPNCNEANIIACCKGKINSAYGYIWRYKDNNFPINLSKRTNQHNKAIIQLTLSGDFVGEYPSTTEASNILNIGRKSITNCLTGRSKSAGGYKWIYKKGGIYE